MLPGLRASTAWNGVPGGELGSADAKQWCVPWGYELNNISYNRKMFDKAGVEPPKNMDEMLSSAAKLTKDLGGRTVSACAARAHGRRSIGLPVGLFELRTARLHRRRRQAQGGDEHCRIQGLPQAVGPDDPGFGTEELVDIHLVPGRNRPWRRGVGDDLRCRHPRLLHEWRRQQGEGQHRLCTLCRQSRRQGAYTNVWIWSLALSNYSAQKDAAWYFIQWATSTSTTCSERQKMDFVNPVRASVWKDEVFRKRIDTSYPGYLNQHDVSAPGAKIYFTAQPLFFDLTTQWAETLQKMVAKELAVDEGLDQLAANIDKQLKDAGLG